MESINQNYNFKNVPFLLPKLCWLVLHFRHSPERTQGTNEKIMTDKTSAVFNVIPSLRGRTEESHGKKVGPFTRRNPNLFWSINPSFAPKKLKKNTTELGAANIHAETGLQCAYQLSSSMWITQHSGDVWKIF